MDTENPNGDAIITSRAVGGVGAEGVRGGTAESTVVVTAAGAVDARSTAVGGATRARFSTGFRVTPEPDLGPVGPPDEGADRHATAMVHAVGAGESEARAIANLEEVPTLRTVQAVDVGQTASARARASGHSGLAESTASGLGGEVDEQGFFVNTLATTPVLGSASSWARVGAEVDDVLASDADATAFATGAHRRAGEWGRVGLQLLDRGGDADIALRSEARFANELAVRDSLDGLFLTFLDHEVEDLDVEQASFRIESEGQLLLERVFENVAAVVDFFSEALALGDFDDDLTTTKVDLRVLLELEGGNAGARIGAIFALGTRIVPEPGTGWLVVFGLVVLSRRRRRDVRVH
ncbi:MAG: PEP-CTERM sorting domain-containing protein [Myxococcota bacterium]